MSTPHSHASGSAASSPASEAGDTPPTRSWNPLARVSFGVQVIAGLALGLVFGFIARSTGADWLASTLNEIGSLFVQLLWLVVPPLVFCALVVSVTNLRGVAGAARLAVKTLLWFAGTALIAVTIGITLGTLTSPGHSFTAADATAKKLPDFVTKHSGSWLDFLTGLIPSNPIDAFTSNGGVLQIVFLAIVVGVAAIKIGTKADPFVNFTKSLLEITLKALWWVIRLSPLGVLGLIGRSVATYGWDLLAPLATFTVDVYVGCAIVLFVVYPILLSVVAKVNPIKYFTGAWAALQLAFVSRSSVGTMPVTERVVTRMGVPSSYASFAVPLGATTKMDGCAGIYPALGAIFVANAFGVHLDIKDYILIVICSVIGSAATAGLTGALVMLTLTLSTLGLPLAGVGLLLGIDPMLDMMRTMTNVAGQSVVPILVSAGEGTLDRDKFEAASRHALDAPDEADGVLAEENGAGSSGPGQASEELQPA